VVQEAKAMTETQAHKKLKRIAQAQGGQLSQTGHFVELPHDAGVAGYGAVRLADGQRWVIVSVPR